MTFTAMFLDGLKAGEMQVFPSYQQCIRVLERVRLVAHWDMTTTPSPVTPLNYKPLVYKPFMQGIDANVALFSLYRDDPYKPITDVLLPILKIANAETERQRELEY